eukprot:5809895-Pyramimonas_sp.AAC.1
MSAPSASLSSPSTQGVCSRLASVMRSSAAQVPRKAMAIRRSSALRYTPACARAAEWSDNGPAAGNLSAQRGCEERGATHHSERNATHVTMRQYATFPKRTARGVLAKKTKIGA